MKMRDTLFTVIDWDQMPGSEHLGQTGKALWRTRVFGDMRVRLVEYTVGYMADHWCSKGHVLFVVEGSLDTELDDGRIFSLTADSSYQVGDDQNLHRSRSVEGARLFIVD